MVLGRHMSYLTWAITQFNTTTRRPPSGSFGSARSASPAPFAHLTPPPTPCRRPYDSRMWLALAQVYETTGRCVAAQYEPNHHVIKLSDSALLRTTEAIKCHQRALVGAEADSTASILATLARLYDAARRPAEAAASHRRLLTAWAASAATGGGGPPPTGEMVRSWLYLAKYELKVCKTALYSDRRREG